MMFGGGGPAGGGQPPFNAMFGAQNFGPGPQGGPHGFDPFQMLFANGAAPDPQVLEQLINMGVFPAQFGMPQQQAEPTPSKHHPTAASTLKTLPRIKVTAHDLQANEGSECAICLDELKIGEPALRIPCGHLYHEECVEDWLKKSNECPVCRFELPTDDKEHERGRQERMAGRKIRLRMCDLTVKSVQELKRLAHFIGVDIRGCMEKKEIVDRIAASEKVEIIAVEGEEAPSSSSAAEQGLPRSSWLPSGEPMDARSEAPSGTADAPAPPPAEADSSPGGMNEAELRAKSISELRQIARRIGASLDGCLEKGEIVDRILASSGSQR